jgi:two-component system response regulator AtoC
LASLRERKDDIIPLAEFFIKRMCCENHKDLLALTPEAKNKLLNFNWPGNVRELANIIERAVVMSSSDSIGPEHLLLDSENQAPISQISISLPPEAKNYTSFSMPVGISLAELEKKLIIETLETHDNNRKKTAEILGISPRTLRNKLKEYNLKTEEITDNHNED